MFSAVSLVSLSLTTDKIDKNKPLTHRRVLFKALLKVVFIVFLLIWLFVCLLSRLGLCSS